MHLHKGSAETKKKTASGQDPNLPTVVKQANKPLELYFRKRKVYQPLERLRYASPQRGTDYYM
jgi:hypothetical protein